MASPVALLPSVGDRRPLLGSHEGPQSRLLLVDASLSNGRREELAERLHIRVAATVEPAAAVAHLHRMAIVDIVWIVSAEVFADAELIALAEIVAERGCHVVSESTLAGLDRVSAAFEPRTRIEFLVDCDDADRMVALAATQAGRVDTVHDIARDGGLERIDQLQEEVARISRALSEMAGQAVHAVAPPQYDLQSDRQSAFAGKVHAPSRDFSVGPRSFVPEEPAAMLRQKARMVRRVIRQRRMREQYFAADLFADPAWDMLLDLYAARLERQPVSVSSLCIAAAVPATTALRWIKTMTEAQIFVREADPHDGRRIFIALAEAASVALDRYFEALDD